MTPKNTTLTAIEGIFSFYSSALLTRWPFRCDVALSELQNGSLAMDGFSSKREENQWKP